MEEFNNWDAISEEFGAAIEEAVSLTASDGVSNVQNQIASNGQIVSGFMNSSVYNRTFEISTYGQTVAPPRGAGLLPEVDRPEDRYTAYIAVAASYAIFPNYGTRYQAAKPFWEPAIDKTQDSLDVRMQQVADRLR